MIIAEPFEPLFQLDGFDFEKNPVRTYDFYAVTGGRGSLKTGHIARCGMTFCMQNPHKRICFGREVMSSITESLYAELVALVDDEDEFKDRGFWYDKTKIYHLNGSEIFFRGFNDRNKSSRENNKGLANVDLFIVDEAQSLTEATCRILFKTIRKEGAKAVFAYNRVENDLPIEKALFIDYETKKTPENVFFREINYPDVLNTGLLTPVFLNYAELVRKNRPEEYERDYLNKPLGRNVGKVVKYWKEDNINESIRYCPDLDIYLTTDFNVDPMMWVCCHRDMSANKSYAFDEIVIENCTTQDAADEFIRRYPQHKAKIILNGDASGSYRKTQSKYTDYAIIRNAMMRYGYKVEIAVKRFNPPIKNRIAAFSEAVWGVDGERRFFCHPTCKWLIYNMKNLAFKPGTSCIDLPTPQQILRDNDNKLKFLGHIFDAISYHIDFYAPVTVK